MVFEDTQWNRNALTLAFVLSELKFYCERQIVSLQYLNMRLFCVLYMVEHAATLIF